MNKRIRKKVYNRAEEKLMAAVKPGETRSIQQIAREDNIPSPLEGKVFNEIKSELISEGKW